MGAGWQREPVPADPAASRWTWQRVERRAVIDSVLLSAPVPDDDPLPSLAPPHPRLERLLATVLPWWAARRAASRAARYQHAVWARIAAAYAARDHARVPILPSPAGPRWRASRHWQW
jgi:hypothetical protein